MATRDAKDKSPGYLEDGNQAVFRKILGKGKKGGVKIKSNKDGDPGTSGAQAQAKSEELERKKQEWQSELGQMSEFLYIKSSNEQKEEGVEHPVDTAWIEGKDGLPTLMALFDVGMFKEDNVEVKVENDQLILTAKSTEEHDEREYTRTMVRTLDLPKHVDHRMMRTNLDEHGLMHVEMPFHLPPQRRPKGPNVFPIVTDTHGRRKLRIMIYIGSDFTSEDVSVETSEKTLRIRASYDEEIGKYGRQVTKREFTRDYLLPEHLHAESTTSTLAPDGRLFIEILLKDEDAFKTTVETEDVNEEGEEAAPAPAPAAAAPAAAVNGETSSVEPNSEAERPVSAGSEDGVTKAVVEPSRP